MASIQPAMSMTGSTLPARIPCPEYIASRVHSIANYKLRLEASQNEPRLRKLLGHIFVYDAIREHQQAQATIYTSPPAQRRREQQLRRRQMSESSRLSPTIPAPTSSDATTDNAADIKAYLSTLPTQPTAPQPEVHDFTTFQRAIAAQLATLSQVRIEAASRQLYHMTQDNDDADELAVEEYAESDDDDDDDSDYDSYDGDDGDWRHDSDFAFDWRPTNASDDGPCERDGDGDSDTDPDSVNSAPPSPVSEEPPSPSAASDAAASKHHQGLTQGTGACYFLPLRPVPRRRGSNAAAPEPFPS